MRIRECVVAVAALVGYATGAHGDERTGELYLTGGIVMPFQPGASGEVNRLYIEAPGGATHGWSFGGGVGVAERVSVEAEWSTTGWMRAREVSRTTLLQTGTYIEERRDRFALIAARFHFGRTRTVGVEPLIGFAWTQPEGWSTREAVAAQRQRVPLEGGIAPVFGCDLRVGLGRFAVVPSFRALISGVSTGSRSQSSYYPGGYPSVTIRAGAGIRVDIGKR